MANHQDWGIRICTTLIPALKAPPDSSPGQRPGFRNRSVRPARAQESSALSGRKRYLGHVPGTLPRAGMVRAVGASTLAEFSIGETCYGPIYEIGAIHESRFTSHESRSP